MLIASPLPADAFHYYAESLRTPDVAASSPSDAAMPMRRLRHRFFSLGLFLH